MIDGSTLTERQKLLLMAAAVENLRPGTPLTANCGRVLALALKWAGQFSADVQAAFKNDFEYHPVIREWYGSLIEMVQHQPPEERLLEGAGNFGTPINPIALPWFTSCRLTKLGERVADNLLARNPESR